MGCRLWGRTESDTTEGTEAAGAWGTGCGSETRLARQAQGGHAGLCGPAVSSITTGHIVGFYQNHGTRSVLSMGCHCVTNDGW